MSDSAAARRRLARADANQSHATGEIDRLIKLSLVLNDVLPAM